jgi:hypothetical protein
MFDHHLLNPEWLLVGESTGWTDTKRFGPFTEWVAGDDPEFGPWQFLHQPAGTGPFLCKPQNGSVLRYGFYCASANGLTPFLNADGQSVG